jgi:hypothetical protein
LGVGPEAILKDRVKNPLNSRTLSRKKSKDECKSPDGVFW